VIDIYNGLKQCRHFSTVMFKVFKLQCFPSVKIIGLSALCSCICWLLGMKSLPQVIFNIFHCPIEVQLVKRQMCHEISKFFAFENLRSLLINQFMFHINRNTAFSWHKKCLSSFRVILDHLVLCVSDHLPRSIYHSRQEWCGPLKDHLRAL
jgi:hypothetical protein